MLLVRQLEPPSSVLINVPWSPATHARPGPPAATPERSAVVGVWICAHVRPLSELCATSPPRPTAQPSASPKLRSSTVAVLPSATRCQPPALLEASRPSAPATQSSAPRDVTPWSESVKPSVRRDQERPVSTLRHTEPATPAVHRRPRGPISRAPAIPITGRLRRRHVRPPSRVASTAPPAPVIHATLAEAMRTALSCEVTPDVALRQV